MKTLVATVLDPTHLDLQLVLSAQRGEVIHLSLAEGGEEEAVWREAAREHLLQAYPDEDALYDDL